jgi:hypothetical protein
MLFAIGRQLLISPPTEGSAECTVAKKADIQETAHVDYHIT